MRRDHFTVVTESLDPADVATPTLDINYDGPKETLTDQLTNTDGELIPESEIDAGYRFHETPDETAATGVFSLTNRITGEYLLEFSADADDVMDLVQAAREGSEEEASYRIRINREDGQPIVYSLDSMLAYDPDGNLLRQDSLIPSGVEL